MSIEFCQLVARAINYTTWNIPRIRDGNQWRIIENAHLVANPNHINGHDKYEDAIIRAKQIMEKRGWSTEISSSQCHEHLIYHHYRLKCWK
jgi:hypothetical protein